MIDGVDIRPHDLQAALRAAAEQARAVHIRSFEGAERARLLDELVPVVESVLGAGVEALAYVQSYYEAGEPHEDTSRPLLAELDRLAGASAARIADVAALARWQLRSKAEALARIGDADGAWHIVSQCGSGRRHTIKAAAAVERALSSHEGLPSELEPLFMTELQRSLRVRQAYASFRRDVLRTGEPAAGEVHAGLRSAAVAIAKLVGRDAYEDLRIGDRVQLRSLQERVIAWLRDGRAASAHAGLRLWEDVAAFASLVRAVSQRAELWEHDRDLLDHVMPSISRLARDGHEVDDATLRKLRCVAGRDEAIDELLDRGETSAGAWEASVGPVLHGLSSGRAPVMRETEDHL